MTDLEKFKELYRSLGIELVEKEDLGELVLELSLEQSPKLTSHEGNHGYIHFDLEGKFLSQSFVCKHWEDHM